MYNTVREGVDYYIATHPTQKDNWACVTIMNKKYEGVVVRYGELKFGNPGVDGTLDCSYNYDIIEKSGLSEETLVSKEFRNFLGDVIITILCEQIGLPTEEEEETKDDNEPRASNPKKLDTK